MADPELGAEPGPDADPELEAEADPEAELDVELEPPHPPTSAATAATISPAYAWRLIAHAKCRRTASRPQGDR